MQTGLDKDGDKDWLRFTAKMGLEIIDSPEIRIKTNQQQKEQ